MIPRGLSVDRFRNGNLSPIASAPPETSSRRAAGAAGPPAGDAAGRSRQRASQRRAVTQTMATVATTTLQRLDALAVANRVKWARCDLKRRIADDSTNLLDVLENPPAYTLNMPVLALLVAQERWGYQKASRLLEAERISEGRLVGQLTARQRRVLSERVAPHALVRGVVPCVELRYDTPVQAEAGR